MVHFLRAPNRAIAEEFASFLVTGQRSLCLSSRSIPGDPGLPAWKVETIDCFGATLSSARPVAMMNWRAARL